MQHESKKRLDEKREKQMAVADVPLKIIYETKEEGGLLTETMIVITSIEELIFEKTTDKKGKETYYKNGNPVTDRTYILETQRKKELYEEAGE